MAVKEQKIKVVEEIQKKFEDADLVLIAQYRGLTVAADRELRNGLRKVNASYGVYKNNMVKRAIEKSSKNKKVEGIDLDKIFIGPTSCIFSKEVVAPAKVVVKFAKENEELQIKGGIYLNKFIPAEKVKELAALPSKEELLSKLVYLLNSPVTRFVNVAQGPLRKLVYALNAIKAKK